MSDQNKFYVYTHRRIDTGEIFYVGKGHGDRASSKKGRNKVWNYYSKNYGFDVAIVKFGLSEAEAFELESLMIDMLGRKDLGTGCLVNLTDGGEGFVGSRHTEQSKQLTSKKMKELMPSKVIFDFINIDGRKFSGIRRDFYERFLLNPSAVTRLVNGDRKHYKGWWLKENFEKMEELLEIEASNRSQAAISLGRKGSNCHLYNSTKYEFLHLDGSNFFGTQYEFRKLSGLHQSSVSNLCGGKTKLSKGWSCLGLK